MYICGLRSDFFPPLELSEPANNFGKLSLIPHKWLRNATEVLAHII